MELNELTIIWTGIEELCAFSCFPSRKYFQRVFIHFSIQNVLNAMLFDWTTGTLQLNHFVILYRSRYLLLVLYFVW